MNSDEMEIVTERHLKDHQKVMYQMLCEVDRICRNNGIKYHLFAGTELGAVRHRGFIPWDDDLDIIMLRGEYNRFIDIASDELDRKEYFLQREFSDHWPIYYTKLRKNKTACIERFRPKDTQLHQGIYIDIFPCDNLSDNFVVRRLQFISSKVVIAKCLDTRGGYLTNSVIKKLFMHICRLLPMAPFRKTVLLKNCDHTKMVHCFFGAASKYKKSVFPRIWFEETEDMQFEEGMFPVSAYYDEMLTVLYGNYMIPTPVDEREKKVHAEIVDLNRSYEEYIGIQNRMQFTEYTRSIR